MATGVLDHLTADVRDAGQQKVTLFEGLSMTFAADQTSGLSSNLDRIAIRLAIKQMFSQADATVELWNDIITDLKSRSFQKDLVLRWVEQMALGIERMLKAITVAKSIADTRTELFDPLDKSKILLESTQRRFETLWDEVNWWLAALKKPWPPIDDERLAVGLRAAAEGRTVRTEELVSQLRTKRQG
ncbi:MAG TPA: hypothetical protein VG097_13875 [Gemmata sp.]|nr:hypothetical protein [Gemmata sp.]